MNSSFTCCLTDERRPLIHAVQAECINRFMLLRPKAVVVSDEEKGGVIHQVCVKKLSESESLKTYRNSTDSVKTIDILRSIGRL